MNTTQNTATVYNKAIRQSQTVPVAAEYILTERWGVSKGYDTYGYRICTILDTQDKAHKGQCKGGGYDMAGTSLADCLCSYEDIQAKLAAVFTPETVKDAYCVYLNKGRVDMDGGCGVETVLSQFAQAGVFIEPMYDRTRRDCKRYGWRVIVSA